MGDLINYVDYVYLEVNRDYVYKNSSLVHEIDDYLSKYNFIRDETYWIKTQLGVPLYISKIFKKTIIITSFFFNHINITSTFCSIIPIKYFIFILSFSYEFVNSLTYFWIL